MNSNYIKLVELCFHTLFKIEEEKDEKYKNEIIDQHVDNYQKKTEEQLFNLLSQQYTPSNADNFDSINFTSSSHLGKCNLETAIYQRDIKEVYNNSVGLTLHWFYQDMAKNLACKFDKFQFDENNRVLFIDDNIDSGQFKERLNRTIDILKYKTNNKDISFDYLKINSDISEDIRINKDLTYYISEDIDVNLFKCSLQNNGKISGLEKCRYILVDLLIDNQNAGFNIIHELTQLQKYNSELAYEIIVISRSTNTEDIQMALDEGASLYIPKERIFSLPYRISQLGAEKPNFKLNDRIFSSLFKFPGRIYKSLKNSHLEFGNPLHEAWVRVLPKADLHCHLGGSMDAEITLELSFYTAFLTSLNYLKKGNFLYEEKDNKASSLIKDWGAFSKPSIPIEKQDNFIKLLSNICECSVEFISYANDLNKASKLGSINGKSRKNVKKLLKNIFSPDDLIEKFAKENYHLFSGIQSYHVSAFFNVFLSFSIEKINELIILLKKDSGFKINRTTLQEIFNFTENKNDSEKIILNQDGGIEHLINVSNNNLLDNLGRLIQATHSHKLEDSMGGITLKSFLIGCDYSGSNLLQTKFSITRVVQYLCNKARLDNVYYQSFRVTPLNYSKSGLSQNEIWDAIAGGYESFIKSYKEDFEPGYFLIFTIILALKRHYSGSKLSKNTLFGIDKRLKPEKEENFFLNGELCEKFVPFVSGFDLTGLEQGFNPEKFRKEFKDVFKSCMPITIHAGEETPSEYVWEAAYELNADRIGHGLSLAQQDNDTEVLLQRFKDFGITVELCPASNFLTQEGFKVFDIRNKNGYYYSGEVKKWKLEGCDSNYPLVYFLDKELNVVICTDDPAIQGTDLTTEFLWASKMTKRSDKEEAGLTKWEVLHLVRNSFKSVFLPYNLKKQLFDIIDNKIYKLIQDEFFYF